MSASHASSSNASRPDTGFSASTSRFFYRLRAERRLAILAYLGIDHPECFEQQIRYISDNMQPLSLGEMLSFVQGKRRLPKWAVLLTFDDGERSVLEHGLPILRQRGIPGIIFVVTELLDSERPVWPSEAQKLVNLAGSVDSLAGVSADTMVRRLKKMDDARRISALAQLGRTADRPTPAVPQLRRNEMPVLESAGLAVGNHTVTHPCLPRCPARQVEAELCESHELLTEIVDHSPRSFASPNGDADARVIPELGNLGYEAAFLVDHQYGTMPLDDRCRISRLRVNSHTRVKRFRPILRGIFPALDRLRGGR